VPAADGTLAPARPLSEGVEMPEPPTPGPDARSPAVVATELAELRRHLDEMPPHHGGGRAALEERVRRLERELARARDRRA
jgi:hypothetical protein